MTYNMNFTKIGHFDRERGDFGLETWAQEDIDAKREQAEQMGWLLMYVGLRDITKDNIEEIIFRVQFADTIHGSPFLKHKDGKPVELSAMRQTLKDHIGLETNGSVLTRHKFIVNIASNKASDIDYQLRKDLCGIES